jgi:anaerobic magnesium-protoporphyrin IX monomethyl ester cyclase
MRVLFVVADFYFSEPIGVMALSAVCKENGHQTRLLALRVHDLSQILEEFTPDVVAYSVMTPDEVLFQKANDTVIEWQKSRGIKTYRIMGGPHPTFFSEVIENIDLDAICIGDGDRALPRVLDAIESGKPLSGIPNIATRKQPDFKKEIVEDLDSLPFVDRDILYESEPDQQSVGIRSFLTQKGCPYKCTYCFNHAYNLMFKGEGRKLFRRRSVDNLLSEIKHVVTNYPIVRYIRFSDDVFVIRQADDWLLEFSERYPREVGLPFYCLIRPNALTEDVAKLLSQAGCRSISMSIEAGTSKVRNDVLKRNTSDEVILSAFALAKKYKMNAFANSILAIPGTTLEDDMETFEFARKLDPAVPTFSIFTPFPKTKLTDLALELEVLEPSYDFNLISASGETVLSGYSEEEKRRQVNLLYLGTLFCKLPNFIQPILPVLIRQKATGLYRFVGAVFASFMLSTRIFPKAYPRNPIQILKSIWKVVVMFRGSRK